MPQICHNKFWLLIGARSAEITWTAVNPRTTFEYIGARPHDPPVKVDLAKKRREKEERAESDEPVMTSDGPELKQTQKSRDDVPYLRPMESLAEDVLYRPRFDPEVQAIVVDINLAHPFSKAVFSVSPGEGKRSVPRKATTAVQQLIYILGHAEHMLNDDPDNRDLLAQFRRYASMNLRALLAD
jgi:hypothetical protein